MYRKAFALLYCCYNTVPSVTETLHLPSLIVNGQDCISFSLPNKLIRTLLTQARFPNQASQNNVSQFLPRVIFLN